MAKRGHLQPPTSSGFTLIEGLVTVAIIGILTAILLVGIRSAQRTAAVRRAADQVAGHLREAASLAQNGIKAEGCGNASECSQYVVSFTRGSTTYTRQTPTGFGTVTYTLPVGAVFDADGMLQFTYVPPVVQVSEPGAYPIQHAGAASVRAFVCVAALSVIESTPTGCE